MAMRYSFTEHGPYLDVPLSEGRQCLPLEFEVDPDEKRVHRFWLLNPEGSPEVAVDAPWMRASVDGMTPEGTRLRVLLRPSEAGRPGTYLAELRSGTQSVAIVLSLRQPPVGARPMAAASQPLPAPTRATPGPGGARVTWTAPPPGTGPSGSVGQGSESSKVTCLVLLVAVFLVIVSGRFIRESSRSQPDGAAVGTAAQTAPQDAGIPPAAAPAAAADPEPPQRASGPLAGQVILASNLGGQSNRYRLFQVDPTTGDATQITTGTYDDIPSVSPDHSQVVFESKVAGDLDVMFGPIGGPYQPVAASRATEAMPSWSPDGTRICYQSDQGAQAKHYNLYLYEVGSGNRTRLTSHPASDRMPTWSPDGSSIVFTSNRAGSSRFQLYRMPAGGGEAVRLTNSSANDDSPVFSHDGRRLAFVSNRSGASNVFIMDLSSRSVEQVTHGTAIAGSPSWSGDDSEIMYNSNEGGTFQIYIRNLSTRAVRRVPLSSSNNFLSPQWLW